MVRGKDTKAADGLGGVHKVLEPRPAPPATIAGGEAPVVVEGQRAGFSKLVEDQDQLYRAVHTTPIPVEPAGDIDAPEAALEPARTPSDPFTDARVSPDEASVWTAATSPSDKE